MMLSVDDVEFLTVMDRGQDDPLRDYFLRELAAVFPLDEMDHVLGAYMAFLGRTLIRNDLGILVVDRSDARPFEAMIVGSNPAHRFHGIVEGMEHAFSPDRLEYLQRNRRADCGLYRMSVADAVAARLLTSIDVVVLTNIRDAAAAWDDLQEILREVARAPCRVILHGADDKVEDLVKGLGPAAATLDWTFSYPAKGDVSSRLVSFRVQESSAMRESGPVVGRMDLIGFDALGSRVDVAALADSEDSYAEVAPAGHIRDTASEAAPEEERPVIHHDAFRCAHLRGVRLAGHSVVIDRKGRLLSDSLCAQKDMVVEGHYWEIPRIAPHADGGYHVNLPPVGQHCYRKALLLTQAWGENYQHWLFEILPQVTAAWRTGIDTLIVSSDIRRYQRRALELLGFGDDRVITHDLARTMYCDSLLVGSFTAFNMCWVHPAALAVYDRLMAETRNTAKVETPELVYISRSDAEWKRRLLNEGELIERLSGLGFVAVNPGMLDFDDEVQVLSRAKVIVGAVGAGMSNVVFAPAGADIVAVQSPSFGLNSRFFPMVASLRRQNWHNILSTALNPAANEVATGRNDNINIIVDIDRVEAKVKAILAARPAQE
ncbi:MAG: glycosyltransferase family 61 protein [Phyllobacteriaceae bacterium]|nr:glycosyltransferase family 61 protein [Phyllobacteriaceae bacterium]